MKKKVLIIEDEPNIARAEAIILGTQYQIHHAYDGKEGLKKAREVRPDIIILDLMLPKRGGYDVCFNIRQDKVLEKTKIVMGEYIICFIRIKKFTILLGKYFFRD